MNAFKFFLLIILPVVEFLNPDRKKDRNKYLFNWKKVQWHQIVSSRYFSNYFLGFGWIFFISVFGKSIYDLYNHMHLSLFGSMRFRTLNLVNAVLFLLFFDYLTYWWHRANHQLSFLRRFHQVHHSDLEVDTSTTFRFHFIELVLQFFFKIILVFVLKIHLIHLFIFESLLLVFGYFHHGNIYLPKKMTMLISYVIVTPRYHFNHHMLNLNYSNSNYGSILTFWDHLHGTYSSPIFEDNQELGIKKKRNFSDLGLLQLLKMPFKF